jgi:phosphoribosylamine--glycine ligase
VRPVQDSVSQIVRGLKPDLEAEKILAKNPQPFVIKNPLCSPTSPVHTIVCETVEDTRAWLKQVNYAEGVFLQEYLGAPKPGTSCWSAAGRFIRSSPTRNTSARSTATWGSSQARRSAGSVERDPGDKYGLARELIHPCCRGCARPKFNGPLQVTAVKKRGGKWHVIEYNIRIGVTSGPMILRMLANPIGDGPGGRRGTKKLDPRFKRQVAFGCSLTLAGYGYPFTSRCAGRNCRWRWTAFDCDVWWNEVARGPQGPLVATGHRIADVNALAATLGEAVARAYDNIRRIRVLGSYYRTDVGKSLWPPGKT